MKIPKILYGKSQNVKKNIKKIIGELKKGAKISEVCNPSLVELDSNSDMILIEKLIIKNNHDNFFHLYLLLEEIITAFALTEEEAKQITFKEKTKKYYNEIYEEDWLSFLLLNTHCSIWLKDTSEHKRYLERIKEIWPILNNKNLKISFGKNTQSQNIWFDCRMLKVILSTQGISSNDLLQSIENNDLGKFLKNHNLI